MKKILIFLLILYSKNIIFAQNDSSLLKILNRPMLSCETITYNSQSILPTLDFANTDSIYLILNIWESACGENEPILRLKILLEIQNKNINEDKMATYAKKFCDHFHYRVSVSKDGNYNYEYDKIYFNYVPLNSNFDSWTKKWSSQLIENQIIGSSTYLLCLLFSEQTNTFDKAIYDRKYEKSKVAIAVKKNGYTFYERPKMFSFYFGSIIPIGKLSETMPISTALGFKVELPFRPTWSTGISGNFGFFPQKIPLQMSVKNEDKTAFTKSFAGMQFLLTKMKPLKNDCYFNTTLGAGIINLSTDWKYKNIDSDEEKSLSLSTLDSSFGFSFGKKLKKRKEMGLNVEYHFTPFKLHEKLTTPIGNQSLKANLFIKL